MRLVEFDCIWLRRSVVSEKEEKKGKEDNYRYKPGKNASRWIPRVWSTGMYPRENRMKEKKEKKEDKALSSEESNGSNRR